VQAVRKRCDETGTLLVFDEIQTGCGRTGSLFRFEHAGALPDILLLGKAFGGGLPLACFVADSKIMQVLQNNPVLGHITTFGGNAVCCAAALASLKEIVTKKWYEGVEAKAQLFLEELRHPAIRSVRHCGLMMAVELDEFSKLRKVIDVCLEKGLLTDWFLFANNCLRIAPPLIITEDEIRVSCAVLREALDAVYA
jgi:acetylornithine/succinyldiaminopimelate/putrescine aminotransferase